jgi:peptide/nickel transport system permease protein
MGRFLLRRTLTALPLLLLISGLIFALLLAAPGGPLASGEGANPAAEAAMARLRETWGLDLPPWQQYLRWLALVLQGDWGISYNSGQPVLELIAQRLPATLQLTAAALLLSALIVVPLGVAAALAPRSPLDYALSAVAVSGISMPVFWLALMLIWLFSVHLGWLPSSGLGDPRSQAEGWDLVAERVRHLALPVACFTLVTVASLVRYVRGAMLDVLQQDYLRTARAKGAGEWRVVGWHALRNALIPVVTVFTLELPRLFLGSVVIETLFALPGIGRLFIDSVMVRDYPVLMGVLVIASVIVVASNLLADLLYAVLDPRVAQHTR